MRSDEFCTSDLTASKPSLKLRDPMESARIVGADVHAICRIRQIGLS